MKYKILSQDPQHERVFKLQDEDGEKYNVDIYTDGYLPNDYPDGADETAESWRAWLGTYVGKTVEIEKIVPYMYFSSGEVKIIT